MKRGYLIAFEGIDRAGKSTQARLLFDKISNSSFLKFPDEKTHLGQYIRKILNKNAPQPNNLHAMHMLFTSNRWENYHFINNTLLSNQNIILDRYSLSGQVYSISHGLPSQWVLNAEIGLPKPDITIFLNLNPFQASQRENYGNELYDNIDFQTKVYDNYLLLRDNSWLFIDCQNKNISEIHEIIYSQIFPIISQSNYNPLQFYP